MQDFVSMVVLGCAAIASLCLGVMLAYGLCRTGFALLRSQAKQAEALRQSAQISKVQVAEI